MRRLAIVPLLATILLPVSAHAVLCALDNVPAATLLVPYFHVDVGACEDINGDGTHVLFTNVGSESVLVHVTVWTTWAVPVIWFDVYLTGFDSELLNMRAMLCDGYLPRTGSAVSPHGPSSGSPIPFPSCNNTTVVGANPVWGYGAISTGYRAHLHAWLTGQESPVTANCAGTSFGDSIARGFVTLDVVNDCNVLQPADGLAYLDFLENRNVLIGQYYQLDFEDEWVLVNWETAAVVHVEADPTGTVFAPGEQTFYGRYSGNSAADTREPLPAVLAARYQATNQNSNAFTAWRESNFSALGLPCGTDPPGFPLRPSAIDVFDEAQNPSLGTVPLPDALNPVERFDLLAPNVSAQGGWFWLDLRDDDLEGGGATASTQGWIEPLTVSGTTGVPSVFHLTSGCDPDPSFPAIFHDGFEAGLGRWSGVVP